MHSFDPTCEIANSFICIFPRVKFSSHDSVVHHLGHDVKRRVEVNGHPSIMIGFLRNIKGIGPLISGDGGEWIRLWVWVRVGVSEVVLFKIDFRSINLRFFGLLGVDYDGVIEPWIYVEHCGSIVG
ncbi:hypothetical protein Tco_1526511 [Tanacetum coccineum]